MFDLISSCTPFFLMDLNKTSEIFLVILGQSKISLETRIVLVTYKTQKLS